MDVVESAENTNTAVNLDAMLARFTSHWSPKKIAALNDYEIKLVKVQGEFVWQGNYSWCRAGLSTAQGRRRRPLSCSSNPPESSTPGRPEVR